MNELRAVTVGSAIPRTSSEWIIAEMVALVAVDAALASAERMRSRSLPLPLQASDRLYQFRGDDVSLGFIGRQRRQAGTGGGRGGCGCAC
eukprot:6206257-Pleurochrysis_carterae.AAC.1